PPPVIVVVTRPCGGNPQTMYRPSVSVTTAAPDDCHASVPVRVDARASHVARTGTDANGAPLALSRSSPCRTRSPGRRTGQARMTSDSGTIVVIVRFLPGTIANGSDGMVTPIVSRRAAANPRT